jgi:naphtho-gamma-pyrone polyketide synthase
MKCPSYRIYLFGDQTSEFDAGLRRLLQAKNNSFLSFFLERCYHVLRYEISGLSPSERSLFPRFTSVVDLLARYRDSGPNPALESVFTSIYQLGVFIRYVRIKFPFVAEKNQSH